jgi:DNA-binding transcriptional MerR regulator
MQNTYSTAEVAKAIGVGKSTLLRWLQTGQLADPQRERFGGVECRIWQPADLERAREFREQRYGKRS